MKIIVMFMTFISFISVLLYPIKNIDLSNNTTTEITASPSPLINDYTEPPKSYTIIEQTASYTLIDDVYIYYDRTWMERSDSQFMWNGTMTYERPYNVIEITGNGITIGQQSWLNFESMQGINSMYINALTYYFETQGFAVVLYNDTSEYIAFEVSKEVMIVSIR